jgi:hypothetical protein
MQELSTTGAGSGDATAFEPAVAVTQHGHDIFEKRDSVDEDEDAGHGEQSVEIPGEVGQHELPIELASMTDRYLRPSPSSHIYSITDCR